MSVQIGPTSIKELVLVCCIVQAHGIVTVWQSGLNVTQVWVCSTQHARLHWPFLTIGMNPVFIKQSLILWHWTSQSTRRQFLEPNTLHTYTINDRPLIHTGYQNLTPTTWGKTWYWMQDSELCLQVGYNSKYYM